VRPVFALALIAACQAEPARWHVEGGFLRAPDGRAVLLHGANLTGMQKQAPYLDPAGADDYRRLHDDWGMNAIRFVMTWAAVEPERGRYDDAYLDQVAERMRWAADAGLWVVLDMHEDVYGEGFGFDGAPRWTCEQKYYDAFVPRDPWFLNNLDDNVIACIDHFWQTEDIRARFVAAWAHVAARLHDAAAVIGFDVLNEPGWGSYSIFDFEADLLAPLYDRVVASVRAQAPGWVAFLEPSASRNAGIATALPRPAYRDVVYAPHSYDSAAEGSGMFDPTRRDAILIGVGQLAEEAHSLGAALAVGEFGGIPGGDGYPDYMAAEYDAQGAAAAGAFYWDASRGGGYSLFEADGTPKPAALQAIARPRPSLIGGELVSYSFDGASFSLRYRSDGRSATEIQVPPAAWPNGYAIACGGCRTDVSAGAVILHGVPAGEITIELQ
jgi:endoglycosylceramidase